MVFGNGLSRPVARWVSAGLIGAVLAQLATASARPQEAPEFGLQIAVLQGEGAIHDLRRRALQDVAVKVVGADEQPVAGAVVLFTLPDEGASGLFANGSTRLTRITDEQGRAGATGIRPNRIAGQFRIRVDASYRGQRANAVIQQTNTLAGRSGAGSGKILAILAIVGGGAGAGAALALGHGGKGSVAMIPAVPTPTTVTIGKPTVGPPH